VPMVLLKPGPGANVPPVYRHALTIIRNDHHIVWRGDTPPPDTAALIGRLRAAEAAPFRAAWKAHAAPDKTPVA
jgi:hypothetical protein